MKKKVLLISIDGMRPDGLKACGNPYLKELEKTLGNDQVVFVSISIDEDPNAWKAAIKRHNLTGNQFLGNETLATLLKVQGIPRFLIYDKEGRLLYPEAPSNVIPSCSAASNISLAASAVSFVKFLVSI